MLAVLRIIHDSTCVDGIHCQLGDICSYWKDANKALDALRRRDFQVTTADCPAHADRRHRCACGRRG